jgi:hypothetical protein
MRSNHSYDRGPITFTFVAAGATMLLVLLCLAPGANAAAPTPALQSTNPASPGASLKPRIHGDADGIITSVVTSALRSRGGGPIARSSEPGNLITIYTDANCSGVIAAEGSAEQLEGEGIQVTVLPDSVTVFYATETNGSGASSCSKGLEYQQVSTAPAPPIFGESTPASGANDNFPRLRGIAAGKSMVAIFTDSSCSSVIGSGTAAEFSANGIQVHVADNTTTAFYAIATLAGFTSLCSSSSVTYQEITPPEQPAGGSGPGGEPPVTDPPGKPQPPQLRTSPGGIANDTTPVITGGAPGAKSVRIYGSSDCKGPVLAKGTVAQLQAGFPVQIVPNTTVAFYGKAIDGGGDESVCSPVPAVYTDDSIAPKTRITVGPGVKTLKHTVVFRFADTTGGPDTSFLCKVDRKPWKSCHAPLKLKKLGHKRHLLQVKAYDAAGNREKKGVKRSFQVVSSP